MNYPIPKLRTLLWRGWCKKCPQCGQGQLYKRWLNVNERCAVCNLQFLPDQGDLWGPLIFLDRLIFIIPVIVLFFFNLWHPGPVLLIVFGVLMVFTLVFTMPNRNGVSLAVDYLIRRKSGDLVEPEAGEQKEK